MACLRAFAFDRFAGMTTTSAQVPVPSAQADATEGSSRPGRALDAGHWALQRGVLALDRPIVMGILNVTPDSFSDGGRFLDPADAIAQARRMAEEGADL